MLQPVPKYHLDVRIKRVISAISKPVVWGTRGLHPGFRSKNSLNIKFLGGIFLGHPGPRHRDIPDKNFMQLAFFCCLRQGVAGMSRDLGRDVPDLEKLYARKLWADFSYPMDSRSFRHFCGFRDFRESSTQLLVGSCLRRFRDFRRFRERRPAHKP